MSRSHAASMPFRFVRSVGLYFVVLCTVACAPTIPPEYQRAIDASFASANEDIQLHQALEQQLEQGRFNEAEETANRIEQKRSAYEQRCGDLWRQHDEVDALREAGREDEAAERSIALPRIFGCERRPEESEYASTLEEIQRRRSAAAAPETVAPETVAPETVAPETVAPETEAFAYRERETLFVEPLSLWGFDFKGVDAQPASPELREALSKLASGDLEGAKQDLIAALQNNTADQRSDLLEPLAMVAQQQGDLLLAQRYLDEAIADVERTQGPADADLARLLQRKALTLIELGDKAGAIAAGERAFASYANGHGLMRAYALHNLGVIHQRVGELQQARAEYEQSVLVINGAHDLDPLQSSIREWQRPSMLSNLGLAYWQQGDLSAALDAFAQAQALLFGRERLGFELSEAQELQQAQQLAVELDAMQTLEAQVHAAPRTDGALLTLLERKGAVLERRSRMMEALKQAAATEVDAPITTMLSPEAARQALARLSLHTAGGGAPQGQRELLDAYEEALAERSALNGRKPTNPDEQAKVSQQARELDVRIRTMEASLSTRGAMQTSMRKQGAGAQSIDRDAMLEAAEDGRIEEFIAAEMQRVRSEREQTEAQERAHRQQTLDDIQTHLPTHAVLLEMVQYRPFDPKPSLPVTKRFSAARYGVYVIRANAPPEYVDLGETAVIDSEIKTFRAALDRPEDDEAKKIGRELDAVLMAPIRQRLGADISFFFVAPAGALNLLPFSALVDESGHYLIERNTFSWLTSGRDLLRAPSGTQSGPPVVIANPAFDAETLGLRPMEEQGATPASRSRDFVGLRFAPLPATAKEGNALHAIWPDSQLLMGAQATESALKAVHGPRILHLATHGFFLADLLSRGGSLSLENPLLRSGLALAAANEAPTSSDDGVLTALEASALDLNGTELVVLSACDTGVGEVRNGEGVFGLRRAFVAAGADSLLMTLWSVDDRTTAAFMTDFHQRLARGEARSDALRSAQLDLLGRAETQHPFYWASFIGAGDWRPLSPSSTAAKN